MIAVLLVAAPGPCAADDAILGRTPLGVYPLQEPAVTMDAEHVRVEVYHVAGEAYGARVRCEFVFTNGGPAKTVLMGFPAKLKTEDADSPSPHHLEVQDFQAILDGVRLPVSRETAVTPPEGAPPLFVAEWATFEVAFGANQTRRLVHTYEVRLTYDSTGESTVGYVLTTGAMWAKPIGHARIEFAMGPVRPWHLTALFPASYLYSGDNVWSWEGRDLRPEYDLSIRFRLRGWSDDPGKTIEPSPEDSEWRAGFEAVDCMAGDARWLLERHAAVQGDIRQALLDDPYNVRRGLAVLGRYIASRLPPELTPPSAPPEIVLLQALPPAASAEYWRLVSRAIDVDCDLRALAVEVFTEKDGRRTVHFHHEFREEGPWGHAMREIDPMASLPLLAGMMLQATAVDAAGNVVVSQPVPVPVSTGGGAPTPSPGETKPPGPADEPARPIAGAAAIVGVAVVIPLGLAAAVLGRRAWRRTKKGT